VGNYAEDLAINYIHPLVNENVIDDATAAFSSFNPLHTATIYANGQTVVDRVTLFMTKDQTNSYQLPYHCFDIPTYATKVPVFQNTVAGTAFNSGVNDENILAGTVTANEGIYYIESYF